MVFIGPSVNLSSQLSGSWTRSSAGLRALLQTSAGIDADGPLKRLVGYERERRTDNARNKNVNSECDWYGIAEPGGSSTEVWRVKS